MDPPREVTDQVEGRLVGPVQVLEDHHRRPVGVAESLEQGGEQVGPWAAGSHGVRQGPAQLLGHLDQRTEW